MSHINDEIAARKIMEDVEAMSSQAKVSGVSAYLQKPRRVPRPNERFLRNTIASVQHANRRVDEEEMWALYEQRREREARGTTTSKEDIETHESPTELHRDILKQQRSLRRDESSVLESLQDEKTNDDDGELEEFLAGRRKRGRGSRGPQADVPGPYLDAAIGAAEGKELHQGGPHSVRRERGPMKPDYLVCTAGDGSDLNTLGGSESESSGSEPGRPGRKATVDEKEKDKKSKKSKHKKTKRDKKSSSEKKKKKRKSEKKDKKKRKRRRRSRSPPSSSTSESR